MKPLLQKPARSESLRSFRWVVMLVALLLVVAHQYLIEIVFDLTSAQRFVIGVLVFGIVGSLLAWLALTWTSHRVAAAEKATKEREAGQKFISSIVSESADAILTTTLDGVITSWNRGAESIFGYTTEEILGEHFSTLMPEDLIRSGEMEQLAAHMRRQGYVRNVETQRLTKDGRRIFVEVTRTALLDEEGRHWRNSAIVRDITERKIAERHLQDSYEKIVEAERQIRKMNLQLEEKVARRTAHLRQATQELQKANKELRSANQQLKELDRMKSEFVSMVSHALRAPLTNINGAIELLSQGDGSFETDEGKEIFGIIKAESARLTRLVQDVLTVSRLEGGRIELYPEETDMVSFCGRIVQRLNAVAEHHAIELVYPQDLQMAWADRDYTEEILVNLIDNALKYSPDGGRIEVRLGKSNGHITIAVKDEGIGIRDQDMDMLFKSFQRIDGGDNVTSSGYGLGLYTAKRLVEVQGGTIEVESVFGRGSTFTFTVPATETEAPRRHA